MSEFPNRRGFVRREHPEGELEIPVYVFHRPKVIVWMGQGPSDPEDNAGLQENAP
jgi:hypothetical protein